MKQNCIPFGSKKNDRREKESTGDAALKQLESLPNLATLWVCHTAVTDVGPKKVAKRNHLKGLNLYKTEDSAFTLLQL